MMKKFGVAFGYDNLSLLFPAIVLLHYIGVIIRAFTKRGGDDCTGGKILDNPGLCVSSLFCFALVDITV